MDIKEDLFFWFINVLIRYRMEAAAAMHVDTPNQGLADKLHKPINRKFLKVNYIHFL